MKKIILSAIALDRVKVRMTRDAVCIAYDALTYGFVFGAERLTTGLVYVCARVCVGYGMEFKDCMSGGGGGTFAPYSFAGRVGTHQRRLAKRFQNQKQKKEGCGRSLQS